MAEDTGEVPKAVRDEAAAVVTKLRTDLDDNGTDATRRCWQELKPYLEDGKKFGPTEIGELLHMKHVTAANWGNTLIAWVLNKLVPLHKGAEHTDLQRFIDAMLAMKEGTNTGVFEMAVGCDFKLQMVAVYRALVATVFIDDAVEQAKAMRDLLDTLDNPEAKLPLQDTGAGLLVYTHAARHCSAAIGEVIFRHDYYFTNGGAAVARRMGFRRQLQPLPEDQPLVGMDEGEGAEGGMEDEAPAAAAAATTYSGTGGDVDMGEVGAAGGGAAGHGEQQASDGGEVIDLMSSSEGEVEGPVAVQGEGEVVAAVHGEGVLAPGVQEKVFRLFEENWWQLLHAFMRGLAQGAYAQPALFQRPPRGSVVTTHPPAAAPAQNLAPEFSSGAKF